MIVPNQKIIDKRARKEIRVEDLPKKSHKIVKVICDICGKEYELRYEKYNKATKNGKFPLVCKHCMDNSEEGKKLIREKTTLTYLEKYGVEHPLQSQKFLDKRKETCIKKYGVDSYSKTQEFTDKFTSTCLERLGVEYPMCSKDIREKSKQTNLEKYGVENPMQSPEIAQKFWDSMKKNGHEYISSQQEQIFSIIQTKYPEAILEKPEGNFSLDIVIEHNGQKIDIECDGAYWHSDSQKDRTRDEINKRKGYKILRIRYGVQIPDSERIFEAIDELLNTDTNYIRIHSKDSTK